MNTRYGMRRIGLITAVLGTAFLATACAKNATPPERPPKQEPETQLTFAPLEFDTTGFRVHLFWNGYDNDGEVVRFHFAVDADTALPRREWRTTTAKDTILLFLVDPVKEVKQHVFRIAAEDNDSLIDSTPASRVFSAKTLPPDSRIERGPIGQGLAVGPNFAFEWSGIDPDGGETGGKVAVDSFQHLLLLVGTFADKQTPHPVLPSYGDNRYLDMIRAAVGDGLPPPYDDWKWQGIRGLKNRFRNATPGEYVFAERAVDVAGATEKTLDLSVNIRHFIVTTRNPGPQLFLRSSILSRPIEPAARGPEDITRTALQVFEGETVSFSWSADASTYGGDIIGYTYALDDTSSFPGLDPRNTAVTFQPSVLTADPIRGFTDHVLYVRAVDDGGLVTNMVVPLKIVYPIFKKAGSAHQIYFVDDSAGYSGNDDIRRLNYPSDSEEDDWWSRLFIGLGVPFTASWDTREKGDSDGARQPEPLELAPYSTVVWTTDLSNSTSQPNSQTAFYKTIAGGNYSELEGYLRAGGTLILTGWRLAQDASLQASYVWKERVPGGICLAYAPLSKEYDGTLFPRMFMGVDNAVPNDKGVRSNGLADFVRGIPTPAAVALGFDTAVVDTGNLTMAPDPTQWWNYFKWNTNSNPPPSYNPDGNLFPGLPTVEGWNMARQFGCRVINDFGYEMSNIPIAQVIYTYHGVPMGVSQDRGPSDREGLACAALVQSHDLGTGDRIYHPSGSIGRMALFTFPLYFLKDDDATDILHKSFAFVDQSPTLP